MTNPLSHIFRQPVISFTPPSKGKFWPEGSVDLGETGELAVMPMTARDEITLKQPDTLMSGAGTVEVIQSCIPQIKDAWQVPSIDLDSILLAIRIATFGNIMEMEVAVPNTKEKQRISIDLSQIMDQLKNVKTDDVFTTSSGLRVQIKPINYKQLTELAIMTYEEQRMMRTVTDSQMPEADKIKEFQRIFNTLTQHNIDNLIGSIVTIAHGTTMVKEEHHIRELINNISSEVAKEITAKMQGLRNQGTIKPITVTTDKAYLKEGVPETFETTFTVDSASFFVRKS